MESDKSKEEEVENKRFEILVEDQQKIEEFSDQTTENLRDTRESNGKIVARENDEKGKGLDRGDSLLLPPLLSRSDCEEDQVIQEAIRLLKSPILPEVGEQEREREEQDQVEEEEENEMSRLAPKSKVPNRSISRPSVPHVNSRISGELAGQQSTKNAKEDAKNWKAREQELLDRIAELEVKAVTVEAGKEKSHGPVSQGQEKHEEDVMATANEKENYKTRLQQIEKELFAKQKDESKESNLKGMKSPEEIINHLKTQNEDLRSALAKMTAILRDKTALCVNQEKKVAALSNQVESLKEVVAITKDLLNIRNMEVQHISNDISAMESKIDCERQRHNQMLIKMDEAVKLNAELKKEYENQLKLFQQLKESYEEKIRVMSRNGYVEEIKDCDRSPGKTSNFKGNFKDT